MFTPLNDNHMFFYELQPLPFIIVCNAYDFQPLPAIIIPSSLPPPPPPGPSKTAYLSLWGAPRDWTFESLGHLATEHWSLQVTWGLNVRVYGSPGNWIFGPRSIGNWILFCYGLPGTSFVANLAPVQYAVNTQQIRCQDTANNAFTSNGQETNEYVHPSDQISSENQAIASPVADETTYFSYMGPSNKPNNKSQALAAHVTSTLITQPTALKT